MFVKALHNTISIVFRCGYNHCGGDRCTLTARTLEAAGQEYLDVHCKVVHSIRGGEGPWRGIYIPCRPDLTTLAKLKSEGVHIANHVDLVAVLAIQ